MLLARRPIGFLAAFLMVPGCGLFGEAAPGVDSWRLDANHSWAHPDLGEVDVVWVTFFLLRPGADPAKPPKDAEPVEVSVHDIALEGTTDLPISKVCFDDVADTLFYAGEPPAEHLAGRNCAEDLPLTVTSTEEWVIISTELQVPTGVPSWEIHSATVALSVGDGEVSRTTHEVRIETAPNRPG